MAEYYHIWDYRQFDPNYIATLLKGLRSDSRVQMALSGQKIQIEQILLATIADELSAMLWARKSIKEKPKSLLSILLGNKEEKQCMSFKDSNSFQEWWNRE